MLASVVVPSYKEGANVEAMVQRVFAAIDKSDAFNRGNTEMIFVDDNSRDGTAEKVKELAAKGYPVRIIVRTTERGLSSAVMRGFNEGKGKLLLCMDADLQVRNHYCMFVAEALTFLQTASAGEGA